jgi:hypothetical protein
MLQHSELQLEVAPVRENAPFVVMEAECENATQEIEQKQPDSGRRPWHDS